jgi:hypothetical protein
MKRMRVIGLCLVAAFAISAVMAGSASAAAPSFGRCLAQKGGKYENSGCTKEAKEVAKQKFEWTPTILKKTFKAHMTGTLATLETVTGTKITCKAEKNSGAEYSGEKSVSKIVADFTGCETGGIECSNAGAGEIITSSLAGLLGVEKLGTTPPINNKLEVQLTPESAATLAEFKCSTLTIKVTGCVAHPISSGKMLLTATEKFTASKGEQKPDKFLGGPADECALASNNGAGAEESGQTITALVENEEKIEANPAV